VCTTTSNATKLASCFTPDDRQNANNLTTVVAREANTQEAALAGDNTSSEQPTTKNGRQ